MNVRIFGRYAAGFFFIAAFLYAMIMMMFGSAPKGAFWWLLFGGVATLALLWRGWPGFLAGALVRAQAGARFAAPHVRRGVRFTLAKTRAFLKWAVKKLIAGARWLFNKAGEFLGKALSGEWGRDVAALAVCVLSTALLLLAAIVGSEDLAILAGIPAIGGFIMFVVFLVNDRTSIKNMR